MRRMLIVIQAGVLLIGMHSAIAIGAGNPDNGPGCGLGKLAWQDYKGQKEIAPQVMMATTNGTFGSTTFGISSGTSGCTNDGVIMGEMKTQAFTEATFASLSQDMARGGGEHLTSLATLLGVPADHHGAFFERAQARYLSHLEAGETTTVAVIRAVNESGAAYPRLAQLSSDR